MAAALAGDVPHAVLLGPADGVQVGDRVLEHALLAGRNLAVAVLGLLLGGREPDVVVSEVLPVGRNRGKAVLGLLLRGRTLSVALLGGERSKCGVRRQRHAASDGAHGGRDRGDENGAAAGAALVEPPVLAVLDDVPAPLDDSSATRAHVLG